MTTTMAIFGMRSWERALRVRFWAVAELTGHRTSAWHMSWLLRGVNGQPDCSCVGCRDGGEAYPDDVAGCDRCGVVERPRATYRTVRRARPDSAEVDVLQVCDDCERNTLPYDPPDAVWYADWARSFDEAEEVAS